MFLFEFKETLDFKDPVFVLKWLKSVVFEDAALTEERDATGDFKDVLAFDETVLDVALIVVAFVVFVAFVDVAVFFVAHFFFEQFGVS